MDKWTDSAKNGVARVIIFSTVLDKLTETSGTTTASIQNSVDVTDALMSTLQETIDGMSIAEFTAKLDNMTALASAAAGGVAASISGDDASVVTALDAMDTAAKNLGIDLMDATSGMNEFNKALAAKLDLNEQDFAKERLTANAQNLKGQIETKSGPSYWLKEFGAGFVGMGKQVGNFFTDQGKYWRGGATKEEFSSMGMGEKILNIFSGGANQGMRDLDKGIDTGNADKIEKFKKQNADLWEVLPRDQQAGLKHMLEDVNIYFKNSLIPDSMASGLMHMYSYMYQTFAPDGGIIPSQYKAGLGDMTVTTTNFASSLKQVAMIAKDATDQVNYYARAYYSAMDKIKSMAAADRKRG
jgi:hypothetical protein